MAKEKPRRKIQKGVTPKNCYFDVERKEPDFSDVQTLRRFLTERGKIVPRSRSGICAKHQRRLSSQIKYARHLGLLPFISRV